ncbi:PAS domain-containing sensor histidine kinase [Flavobacterium gawalongense]|uniref:histidine kinase n=1 Tax=Flavobacterium gawalongense TaxID=2594432 RepID=A0A553BV22_9FLAO|nr:PAS domain-containing sensor histidine kinase [Flavobacterium gawalongense]TRX02798.1 PAS domain S-box protein [Flavobacterium gawalongense]TRX08106.1 PAS domain S-box protein [Flavobacterium gawalongense]TRX11384.1 PAS domain S-box protein [Flavobacterium gawalongense]TRX12104.1 PAS domain S-box protein [Flavobacterium gawalongense]TRX29019.1 PAS domain S-box protein [Flavobacterium gawalongense]
MTNKLELYYKAAQSAKIGIWKLNLKTNQVFWDAVTKCILEVPEDFIPIHGSGINFYTEGENKDKIEYLIEKAISEGISFEDKFQITTAKNNIKHVECICQVEMKNGKPTQLLGTFQDITKEQNLINELQLNVEKFSSIFSSANDAIIIIDSLNGIISDCNTRASELTGYDNLELIGLNNSELFPTKHREKDDAFISNHLIRDDYTVNETYIITKSADIIPVEVASGKKFMVNDKTYLVCFFRNISERKNVEGKLNLLSLAASETTDTIVIANPQGEAIWANNAYLNLTGLSIEEVIGQKPGYLSKGPETDLQATAIMRKAIQDKKSIKITILNYNKQKKKYWFELNITTVFDSQNNLINFIGVGRDVTLRIEKEIELKHLLEVTSQQNKKLYNFTHIVSHNIRSHTSNLAMVVDVIENTENTAEKLSYFDLFKEGTEKLSETIEYLNEIITIQQKTNIEKTKIRLKDEIEKTKKALSLVIKESQITITHTIPNELIVNTIPAYLDSILLNLFTNAIKYRSPEREAILEIGYEVNENFTIITFRDNGLGLNLKQNGHKIFGMYKTFHGNEDAKGIGLFITKNQLVAMGGKIEVESEVGFGSVFKIYLNEK